MARVLAVRFSSRSNCFCRTLWLWSAAYFMQRSTLHGSAACTDMAAIKSSVDMNVRFIVFSFSFLSANLRHAINARKIFAGKIARCMIIIQHIV